MFELINEPIDDLCKVTTCSCCDDGDSPDCDNGFDPWSNGDK